MKSKLITQSKAAQLLGCSRWAIVLAIRSGRIKAMTVPMNNSKRVMTLIHPKNLMHVKSKRADSKLLRASQILLESSN